MRIRYWLTLAILLLFFCSCKKAETSSDEKLLKSEIAIDTTTFSVYDSVTIAANPFKSSNYEFAESAEVFRERFNSFMRKSGYNMILQKGVFIEGISYNTSKMQLNRNMNIVAKLNKKNNEVIKVVLFSEDQFNTSSSLLIIKAMKGMIMSGPGHNYLTADDAEVILYRAGTLGDKNINPQGLWRQDGIRYEIDVKLNKVVFGVSSE